MPSQHGIHDWLKHGNMNDSVGKTWHGPEESIEYLGGLTGFTDILSQNGYTCGLSGKWHLGASDVRQKSHDFWCSHALGGDSYTDYWVFDNSSKMTHKTQYVTDFFTDRAIDFLNEQKYVKLPFCLSIPILLPIRRESAALDIWSMYADINFLCQLKSASLGKLGSFSGAAIQGYYTTITAMDRAIGRILNHLDATGLAENTILIFTTIMVIA